MGVVGAPHDGVGQPHFGHLGERIALARFHGDEGAAAERRLLEELLESDVGAVDILVLERGDRVARPFALDAMDLLRPGLTLAPPDHVIRGATALLSPATIPVVDGVVRIDHDGRRLRAFGQ
ncbi:MAG: hypothetical protein O3C27_18110 [Actinomycetota bacterium]|nr:hypothetical protein [Actinomycetota bacterium]